MRSPRPSHVFRFPAIVFGMLLLLALLLPLKSVRASEQGVGVCTAPNRDPAAACSITDLEDCSDSVEDLLIVLCGLVIAGAFAVVLFPEVLVAAGLGALLVEAGEAGALGAEVSAEGAAVEETVAVAAEEATVETEAAARSGVRREPRRARRLAAVVAALAVALVGALAGLKLWQSAVNSVPVLAQYAPRDRHSIIQAVSLSSSMSQDFDPARVGTKFDKNTRSAVLWYRWQNAAPGQILEISWSKDGAEILRQRSQIGIPSGEQVYALRTPDGSPLPEGSYEITLIEAGKPIATIPFQIGAEKRPPIPQGGAGIAR